MPAEALAQNSVARKSYADRVPNFANNLAAQQLLKTMEQKKSNLCISVDVTTSEELVQIIEAVGEEVCLIKTHIDIISDFTPALVTELQRLSKKYSVNIFEDRKFADIGNTVTLQYSAGVHKISSWAHLTNAHLVPGPGIIAGLAKEGKKLGRGCLLLAEMSSKGNLCTPEYRDANVKAAVEDKEDFIVGFIAMNRVDEAYYDSTGAQERKDFLILTPGVNLSSTGDGLGQQYRTPTQVIEESGCDVIIVGRGIYGALLTEEAKSGPEGKQKALAAVVAEAKKYREEGWKAYQRRIGAKDVSEEAKSGKPKGRKRKLFEPSGPAPVNGTAEIVVKTEPDSTPVLVRRSTRASAATPSQSPTVAPKGRRSMSTRAKDEATTPATPRRVTRSTAPTSEEADESAVKKEEEDGAEGATPSSSKRKGKSKQQSFFDISPRKKQKTIKIDLEPHEVKAAPKRWKEAYEVMMKQRKRIIAPVDTMGCEENGTDEHRADGWREEDEVSKAKRQRFTTLVSLMLSSQTKDPVTAEAVKNLQTKLPNGLCLDSLLKATDKEIQECISKVGFWRRKTGYIKSAAKIISEDFDGDVPDNVHDLCSIPGVGPKMAFLQLQSMGQNIGIGVDVHVHRMSNRLGWAKTEDPEDTRLRLQSFLPKELHLTINKALVGFGQVICVPVSPRCDLCDLAKAKLCPSRRKVDPKSIANRVQVHLLDDVEDEEEKAVLQDVKKDSAEPEVKVKLEVSGGPDGDGVLLASEQEVNDAVIKTEDEQRTDW